MKRFIPASILAFSLLIVQGFASVQAQDKVLERVLADWNKRQHKLSAVRYELSGKVLYPKGSFNYLEKTAGSADLPTEDKVFEKNEKWLIDFKNTLIVLTTNVGAQLIAGLCKDRELGNPDTQDVAEALRAPLLEAFPAALLGRLVVIPYYPLNDEVLGRIIRLQLDRVVARMRQNHSVDLRYDDDVLQLIASRCTEPESGGRMIDAILTNTLLPQISRELLGRIAAGGATAAVDVSVKDDAFECKFQ